MKDARPGVIPICEATGMVFFEPLSAKGTGDLEGALLACIYEPDEVKKTPDPKGCISPSRNPKVDGRST